MRPPPPPHVSVSTAVHCRHAKRSVRLPLLRSTVSKPYGCQSPRRTGAARALLSRRPPPRRSGRLPFRLLSRLCATRSLFRRFQQQSSSHGNDSDADRRSDSPQATRRVVGLAGGVDDTDVRRARQQREAARYRFTAPSCGTPL